MSTLLPGIGGLRQHGLALIAVELLQDAGALVPLRWIACAEGRERAF